MGVVLFWAVVAVVIIGSIVASVMTRQRRARRVATLLATPGAAEVALHGTAEGRRSVAPTLRGQSATGTPT